MISFNSVSVKASIRQLCVALLILAKTSAAFAFGIRRNACASSFSSNSDSSEAMSTAFITFKMLLIALNSLAARSSIKMFFSIFYAPFCRIRIV